MTAMLSGLQSVKYLPRRRRSYGTANLPEKIDAGFLQPGVCWAESAMFYLDAGPIIWASIKDEVFSDDNVEEETPTGTGVTPSMSTPIVMVDLSGSSSDGQSEPENFHTPPEFSHSQQSGDAGGDGETMAVDEIYEDAQKIDDLGEDSENLGFPEPISSREINVTELAKLSENLGFSEPAVIETERVEIEDGLKVNPCPEAEFSAPSGEKSRICTEIIGTETPSLVVGNTDTLVMVATEKTDIDDGLTRNHGLASEEVYLGFKDCSSENASKLLDKMPQREAESSMKAGGGNLREESRQGEMARKNIEDIDRYKYVTSGVRDELRSSMRPAKQRKDDNTSDANQIFMDLLIPLMMSLEKVNDDNGDDDLLEIAKKRGMTLPQPRWWPQDGFED